jgi:hypothetical protein
MRSCEITRSRPQNISHDYYRPDGITFFAIPRSQTRNLFAPSITEDASNVLMILPLSEDRSNRTLAYARRNDIGYLVVDSVLVSLMII